MHCAQSHLRVSPSFTLILSQLFLSVLNFLSHLAFRNPNYTENSTLISSLTKQNKNTKTYHKTITSHLCTIRYTAILLLHHHRQKNSLLLGCHHHHHYYNWYTIKGSFLCYNHHQSAAAATATKKK